MSDLLERMARAILRLRLAQAGHTGDDAWFERQWRSGPFPDLLEQARAALRECETPTEEMVEAGVREASQNSVADESEVGRIFRSMIRTALGELDSEDLGKEDSS